MGRKIIAIILLSFVSFSLFVIPAKADTVAEYKACYSDCGVKWEAANYDNAVLKACDLDCKKKYPSGSRECYNTADGSYCVTIKSSGAGATTGNGNIIFNVPLGDLKDCKISATENNCLGLYLKAWYGFAIGIAGILATAVIMYGGFKYLTSRGDKSAASKGKEYIISAITGLALIFLSYTIISLVNPTLTVIRMPALPSFKDTSGVNLTDMGSHGTPTSGGSAGQTTSNICSGNSGSLNTDASATFPPLAINADALSRVNKYDAAFTAAANQYGVSARMLKAIALAESAGKIDAISSAGACGLMQFMPATAKKTCTELINDPVGSINLAAQYLQTEQNNGITRTVDQIAGYNAGTSRDAGHALGASNDCPGKLAWECCINAGGLSQTQDYVGNVMGYYKTLIP